MDVTFFPLPAHTAIMNYALYIINNRDIKNLIGEFKVFDKNNFGWTNVIDQEQWKYLCGLARKELSKINPSMHKTWRDRVVGLVRSLCVEIQKWMDDHRYIEMIGIEDSFYWSYEGLIDREKTAEELVRNESLSIQSRYELACNYCFMYHIENLWNFMTESEKRRYSRMHMQNNRIIEFWTKWVITGARKDLLLSPDNDFDQLCFSAYYSNSATLSYFLQLLTTEDKEQYLTKIAREKYLIPNVMHFCLLEMDCNQKAEMFKKTPFKTLKCFLDYPWQNTFLIMSMYMWPYLQETEFVNLIYFIIYERIIPEWDDCDYVKLLTKFWFQSPDHFKTYAHNQDIFKLLNFLVDQMTVQGFVNTVDLNNFLSNFILPKAIKKRYQKACRSC